MLRDYGTAWVPLRIYFLQLPLNDSFKYTFKYDEVF